MPLLSEEERKTLTPEARRVLRKIRKRAKWGQDHPPWLDDVADLARAIAPLLKDLAREGVRLAAQMALSNGRERHNSAVEHVLRGLPDIAQDRAAEAVWRAYEDLAEDGEIG